MSAPFRVGITRDILDSRGEPAFGRAALEILDRAPGLTWEYLPQVVAGDRRRSCRGVRRDLREHRARARGCGRPRGLPAARRRAARRRLRLGRRRCDDARRRARDQHAERDAAAGRDDRAHVRPGARRQAVPQGSAHAHRPLARAHGPHGARADRAHARRRRRRPHRQGAAADGANVRPAADRLRSARERRRARATSAPARSRSTTCCAKRTSSSPVACSTRRPATCSANASSRRCARTHSSSTSRAARSSTSRR